MNSAGKRRVSRAVRQAVSGQGDNSRNEMDKWMACFQEAKLENLSDNDREMAHRQIVYVRQKILGTLTVTRQQGEQKAEFQPTHAKQRPLQAQLWVRRVCGPEPRLVWTC